MNLKKLLKLSFFLSFFLFPIIVFGASVNFNADTTLEFNPDVSPQILVASSSACDNLTLSGTNLNVLIPAGSSFQLKNSSHSLIKLTPSGGSVELVLNVAPSSQEYVSGYLVKWQASSTVSNATVAFEVGVSKANTYYQVNVDGSYFGSYQSNSSGIVSFTYNGGFSTKTFTIEESEEEEEEEEEEEGEAPSSFSLISPANGSNITDKTPTFSWNASSDTDLSHYQLYLDGSLLADNLTSTSYTPSSNLSCGSHTWYVKAVDEAGNTTQSETFSFKINCAGAILPIFLKQTSKPTFKQKKETKPSKVTPSTRVKIKEIKSRIITLQKQVLVLLQKLYLELLKKYLNLLSTKVPR